MKPERFTLASNNKETLINPECVTDVIETDKGTAIYNQDLKLAVVKESAEDVCERLTASSEQCGIRRLLDSDIPEFKDIQFIPENVDEYLNSHKEVLAFDFYDQICNDRVVRYFESEEVLEKWFDAYPFHRGCIYVYHKDWIPYTGQAITIPPDTVIVDADKILCSMSKDVLSKLTPEESQDEWENRRNWKIQNRERCVQSSDERMVS